MKKLSEESIDIEEIDIQDLPSDIKKAGCPTAPLRNNPCGVMLPKPYMASKPVDNKAT